jgi:hypothetical protein
MKPSTLNLFKSNTATPSIPVFYSEDTFYPLDKISSLATNILRQKCSHITMSNDLDFTLLFPRLETKLKHTYGMEHAPCARLPMSKIAP